MPQNNSSKPFFHKTQSSFYYDSRNFAMPRFPTVYQLDMPKTNLKYNSITGLFERRSRPSDHSFTLQLDALYELYFEGDRLLNRDDLFLYNYLQSLTNRGLMLRLRAFADYVKMDDRTFTRCLDQLENAMLIHRVNRQDLHGKPNDLIVHQPSTYEAWKNGQREIVIKRLDINVVELGRKEISITKTDDDGNTRRYVPRTNGKFHFSYKDTIKKTFDSEADSETFAKSILRHFYDAKAEIVKDVKKFDNELRKMVKDSFVKRNLQAEEKHFRAALTMRKIYAPVIGEF